MKEFKLKEDYIELIRLLKYMRLAETGGHAKIMVDEGMVMLNGEVESRKRAKIRVGDIVEVEGQQIKIIASPDSD
jgi:ribosome-associated protein